MKNCTYILALFSVIGLLSCEETSIDTIDAETPVVSGYLYAGQSLDSLRVTLSNSYAREDTQLVTLDELQISIKEGDNTYSLTSYGAGYYQQPALRVELEKSYNLEFEWGGATISASAFVPGKREASLSTSSIEMEKITNNGGFPGGGFTQIDPIEVSWDNPEGEYYYVLIENLETNPEYVNDFLADLEEDLGRRFRRITEPSITDFHSINPRREITQYGTHRVIVFRVSPEYAALYQTSGTSSQSLTEPPSNIDNGLGIFTGVSSDTLYFEVKKI
ncbi:MAG: DUF4249 domain-containing protein [Saprospiraceae bacterium]|nr:DUF4249 domain-containing protein [Saprospiraceae bacterium]